MHILLIIPLLGYCMYMLALTIVNESMACWLFGFGVLLLGNKLCRATNWIKDDDSENTEKP